MRKIFLYILVALSLVSCYQETNLDFLWNGSIEASDSTLIDSITGVSDADYKLTDVDFALDLGYIPRKTAAKMVWFGDTIPLICIFQNYNYADTLFTKIAGDSIMYIAHYSTPTTDDNDFFQTPPKATTNFEEVGVGKTHATIDVAYAAASIGDTIYVYDGNYDVATVSTYFWFQKALYFKAVGRVKVKGVSGNRTVLFVNSGTKVLDGFWISGENSTESAIQTFSGSTGNTIINCYMEKAAVTGANDPINIFSDSELNLENSVFIGNGNASLLRADGLSQSFNNCFIGGDFTLSLNTGASDTTTSFYYTDFQLLSGDIISSAVRAGDYNIRYCNVKLINPETSLFDRSQSGSGTNVFIVGNTIISDTTSEPQIRLGANVYDNIVIDNNSFEMSDTGQVNPVISISNINCNLDITRNFFNTLSENPVTHTLVAATTLTAGIKNINYNEHWSRSIGGYVIRIGTETTLSGDNLLDGGNIIGNKILGPLCFNPALESVAIHAVFIGFNSNWLVKNNYVHGGGINYLNKSSSGINTSGGFFNNISINPYLYSFYAKGQESVKMYNNTSANYLDNVVKHFYLSENLGGDGANNCDVRNNIAKDTINDGFNVGIRITSGVTGTISDYNLFYMAGGNFGQDAINTRTLNDWQTINSLDLNSLDTDPNFKSTSELWPTYPSDAFINGTDLGANYDTLLNTSSVWPDTIVNKVQYTNKIMGAFISPFLEIDNYVTDTLTSIWSKKFNFPIWVYNDSDTIELGVDNFEVWSANVNVFIDSANVDTIIYGSDNFEAWRTKFNDAVDSINNK